MKNGKHKQPPKYMPTPLEIRQQCWVIQATWTKTTELSRRGGATEPLEIPDVKKKSDGMVRRNTWNSLD